MAGIGEVKASIEKRLSELREEQRALERALSALRDVPGTVRRGPGRPKGSANKRRSGGRRAKHGSRAAEALKLVTATPGATIPTLAKEMNISPPYLYRVLPKLAEEGKVKKDGAGWYPA